MSVRGPVRKAHCSSGSLCLSDRAAACDGGQLANLKIQIFTGTTFRVTTLGVAAGINVEAVVRYIYNLVFLSTLVPGCCEGKFEVVTTRQQTGHRHSGRVHSHGLG